MDLLSIVKQMKIKDDKINKEKIIQLIQSKKTLTEKCILLRKYLKPQSTDLETICKKDLNIGRCNKFNIW